MISDRMSDRVEYGRCYDDFRTREADRAEERGVERGCSAGSMTCDYGSKIKHSLLVQGSGKEKRGRIGAHLLGRIRSDDTGYVRDVQAEFMSLERLRADRIDVDASF